MPIEFHCPKCNQQIRAPDDAGGKRGKCPSCQQSVYIPTPVDKIEPLELTPLDEQEERERERMLEETRRLAEAASQVTRAPQAGADGGATPMQRLPDADRQVIQYVKAMAEGRLEEAEQFAAVLRRHPDQADEAIQRLTMDEMPPDELADVPRPVLLGFLKQLQRS